MIDAIIYGRELSIETEEFITEERFDKIRYYLKHGKYPNGADRAEKSRLRSAATHYKIITEENGQEKLMLKDKEVIADGQQQYEIARGVHEESHGGINKTTAIISEKYHWVRIKETVSLVIRNCSKCKETAKVIPTVTRPSTRTKKITDARNGEQSNRASEAYDEAARSISNAAIASQASITMRYQQDGQAPTARMQAELDPDGDDNLFHDAQQAYDPSLPIDPQIQIMEDIQTHVGDWVRNDSQGNQIHGR